MVKRSSQYYHEELGKITYLPLALILEFGRYEKTIHQRLLKP